MSVFSLDSASPECTRAFGRRLAQLLPAGTLVALHGELGAGKTELTRGFAEGLGLDAQAIRSPTYTLHQSHGPLEHLDAYRLADAQALIDIGFLELLDGTRFVLLEWAERVVDLLPEDTVHVRLEHRGPKQRHIEVEAEDSLVARLNAAGAGRLRVTVVGATGRLGRTIVRRVLSDPGFTLAGAVTRPLSPCLESDVGLLVGLPGSGVLLSTDLPEQPGTVIDVSHSSRLATSLEQTRAGQHPLVVATTGHDEDARASLRRAGELQPVLFAPNLSLGVALLKRLVAQVARVLPEADTEIVEAHHNQKADAPSGTARLLFETVRDARSDGAMVCGRRGDTGPRKPSEIGVHALRLGDVVGEHRVSFAWDAQRIELSHRAHSRDVFAAGALGAARFLATCGPGYYTVDDLIAARLRSHMQPAD